MNNVQNVSFTTDIAQFITKTKIDYDRNTRFRPTMKAITDTEEKYQAYLERCRQELENLREQYCSGMLAYAFIRLIHQKYKPEEHKDGTCTILGKTVHLCNLNRPSDIIDEDRKIYAEILTSIVTKNRGKEQGRRWKPIFKKLMSDKKEYLTLTTQNRKEIEEACIALNWESADLDFLLLRLGDTGLQANSLHDMLVRFVLDTEGASFEHYEKLQTLCGTFKSENSVVETNYKAGETKVTYKRLEMIIKDPSLKMDEKITQYVAELEKYAGIFQGRSKTARNTLEHILLLTAHGLGWKIEEVETYLKDFLDPQKKNVMLIEPNRRATLSNTILFDYSKVILGCKIEPLSENKQKQLVQAVLSHYANTDSDIFEKEIAFAPSVYDPRLSYPSAEATRAGVEFFKAPLTRHFEHLLRGEEPIKKQDMLFALYLLCAKVSKVKEPGNYYKAFEKTANAVLTHCNLPKWYAPHVLEYTIGKAIFGGSRFEDVFGDITEAYKLMNGARLPDVTVEKKAEGITNETEFDPFEDAFKDTIEEIKKWSQKITTQTKIKIHELDEQTDIAEKLYVKIYKANEAIYANLQKIAKEICLVWKNTGWLGMHVVFYGMSRSIVVHPGKRKSGYHPVVLQNALSEELFSLLHEPDEKNAMLRAFFVPMDNDTALSLDDFAKCIDLDGNEKMSDIFAKYADINRKFRRKVILTIIMHMVLNEEIIPVKHFANNDKPQVDTRAEDFLLKLPQIDVVIAYKAEHEADGRRNEDESAETDAVDSLTLNMERDALTEEEEEFLAEFERKEQPYEVLDKLMMRLFSKEILKNTASITAEEEQNTEKTKEEKNEERRKNNERLAVLRKRSPKARDFMIYYNIPLITFAFRKKFPKDKLTQDLVSEGLSALTQAVDAFKVEKGNAFSTYAVTCIQNHVSSVLVVERLAVYVPSYRRQVFWKIYNESDNYYKTHIEYPDEETLAELSGHSLAEVREALKYRQSSISLDENVGSNTDDDNGTARIALMADPTEDVEERGDKRIYRAEFHRIMTSLLTLREREVYYLRYGQLAEDPEDERTIENRYGDTEGYSRDQVSKILNIPVEQVARTELDIIRKLSHPQYAKIKKLCEL